MLTARQQVVPIPQQTGGSPPGSSPGRRGGSPRAPPRGPRSPRPAFLSPLQLSHHEKPGRDIKMQLFFTGAHSIGPGLSGRLTRLLR